MTKTELKRITKHALEKNVIVSNYNINQYLSKIHDKIYLWEYRRFEGFFNSVCNKNRANQIRVYDTDNMTIKTLWF